MGRQAEDLTNRRFGMLTVTERVMINNRTHWKCKCDCGGEKIVYGTFLKSGKIKTCGCKKKSLLEKYRIDNTYIPAVNRMINANNTSGHKGVSYRKDRGKWAACITFQRKKIFLGHYDDKEDAIKARKIAEEIYFGKYNKDTDKQNEDLIGKKFGMLTVVGRTIINNRTYWKCKCDCGGERITRTHNLKIGETKTCGCKLKRPLYKNNTSGHRGVGYLKNNKKYHARIKHQGKDIHLGCFDNIEEAIKARQLAEEKYFGKTLDEKE